MLTCANTYGINPNETWSSSCLCLPLPVLCHGPYGKVQYCIRPEFFELRFHLKLPKTGSKAFYFHVNGSIGIVQKIDFEIRPDLGCTTLKTSRKVVLDNPSVCLSVWPSVLLSLFLQAPTGVRFNRSIWNFRGIFGYMWHCTVPIFEAIREPVYKII